MCIIFIYEYIVNQGHVNVNKYIFFIAQDDEFFFKLFDQIFKYPKLYNNKIFVQYNYLLSMMILNARNLQRGIL